MTNLALEIWLTGITATLLFSVLVLTTNNRRMRSWPRLYTVITTGVVVACLGWAGVNYLQADWASLVTWLILGALYTYLLIRDRRRMAQHECEEQQPG